MYLHNRILSNYYLLKKLLLLYYLYLMEVLYFVNCHTNKMLFYLSSPLQRYFSIQHLIYYHILQMHMFLLLSVTLAALYFLYYYIHKMLILLFLLHCLVSEFFLYYLLFLYSIHNYILFCTYKMVFFLSHLQILLLLILLHL